MGECHHCHNREKCPGLVKGWHDDTRCPPGFGFVVNDIEPLEDNDDIRRLLIALQG